jgi:hypothetical protein
MREAMRSAIKSAGPHGATHRFDPPESTSTPYGTGPQKRADQSESTRPLGGRIRAGPPDDWISPESTFMLCGQDGGRELVRDRIRRSSGSARIDAPAGIRPSSGATRVDIHAVRTDPCNRLDPRSDPPIRTDPLIDWSRPERQSSLPEPIRRVDAPQRERPAGRQGAGEVAVGFEPTNHGFAIRSLRPLGYATDAGTIAPIGLSVNATPLVRARSAPPVATIPFRALA